MTDNEFSGDGKLLGSEAKCFLSHFEGYAFNFEDDASGCDGEHVSYGVTLTFTHSDVSGLLGDGFVGEDTNPALSLTLHIARHGHTGSLNLASGDPVRFEALDTETAEGKLVTTLGVAFAASLLWSAIFGSFRL